MKKVKITRKDALGRIYSYYRYIDDQEELTAGIIGIDKTEDERDKEEDYKQESNI